LRPSGPAEILGLEVADVSFGRETVTFRANEHRRLKTRTSHRVVPLWPQLREILQNPYVDKRVIDRGGTLLFPSETGGMLRDWRKVLDAVAKRAGWKAGEIRSKHFRHTYCGKGFAGMVTFRVTNPRSADRRPCARHRESRTASTTSQRSSAGGRPSGARGRALVRLRVPSCNRPLSFLLP
jgi:integrase